MEARELASSKLSKVHASMRSDYAELTQGLKEGGVKGGFDAAKNIKNRILEKEFKWDKDKDKDMDKDKDKKEPKKVYGGGQRIPIDPGLASKE